jgi:outer membrane protein assembly factor BamB
VTGALYVVAMTKDNGVHMHRLHALALDTGRELVEGGTRMQASVAGRSVPDDGTGRQVFASVRENQRAALLLSKGIVHVAFGSFCDFGDHHGWLMTFDTTTLRQLGAFSTTPQGTEGGIWQSGGGPAADADGKIYLATGDGSFSAASGGRDYGNSFLKLGGADPVVLDYFTPYNEATLQDNDGDLGSGGVLLLPDQPIGPRRLMVGAGKQGIVYLLNRDDMGRHRVDDDSQIVQSFPVGACASGSCPVFGTPAWFNGTVYLAPAMDRLRAFTLSAGRLAPSSVSAAVFRWPGATPVVSADATANGIVWTLETNGSGVPAVLRAHAAADVSIELFSSSRNAARDVPGPAVKFATPMVFGGRVYIGVQGAVAVYGLLP